MLQPIFSPLIEITRIAQSLEFVDSVIFSSVNGVENSPRGDGRVAYCVGAMTTQAASAAGWRGTQMGETADQLISGLSNSTVRVPLTHLSGVHTRGDIAERLAAAGLSAQRIAVYNQEKSRLTPQAIEALASISPLLVPLFSPRTARSFVDQNKGHAPVHVIALSLEVAEQVGGLNVQTLTVSNRPTRLAMIEAVQKVASRVSLG